MSLQIDLSGPEGNAFALIGKAKLIAKTMGLSNDETEAIIEKMCSDDYNHLLDTLVSSFPRINFEFENDPRDQP